MKEKILILTASYGAGHNIAANTLKTFYKGKGYEVKTIDLVDFIGIFIGKTTQNFYQNFCSKYPNIWKITFNFLDKKYIKKLVFLFRLPFYQNKFDKIIFDYKPNLILSVFPFWGGFIKHNINKNISGKKYFGTEKNYKTGVIVTDAIKIHSIWYLGGNYIDNYFLIDKYSKEEFIRKFNHKKDNIIISFFPIEEKYFIDKKSINKKSIYILLTGLNSDYITILLNNFINSDYKIVIIKGRNNKLFNYLNNKFNNSNFKYLSFINLRENYKNIGIFIGKPGGATVSECIGTNTPIIVPTFIPGQEEGNVKLLEKYKVGIYEKDANKAAELIRKNNWNEMILIFNKIKKKNNLNLIYNTFLNN